MAHSGGVRSVGSATHNSIQECLHLWDLLLQMKHTLFYYRSIDSTPFVLSLRSSLADNVYHYANASCLHYTHSVETCLRIN